MIQVHYERGVYLPNENIWLDPWDAKPFAFVSHAHSDHIAAHDEIIVSERTARLMQARLPGRRNEHVLAFGAPTSVRGLEVTLLPAGHIFGSAQFFLQAEAGTLLYTFRGGSRVATSRHSHYGDDLRFAALSTAAH